MIEDYWIDWFLGAKGNEYFCDIDPEFIVDRFNLTGLNVEVPRIQPAIEVITDTFNQEVEEEERERLEKSARHLYGLIHARYILTARGLQKMSEKYRNHDFGCCPRVHCLSHPLMPIGLHDTARQSAVKLYCAKCEDLYLPKSSRHGTIDGAYFGTSFPGMFFQVYPNIIPSKSQERYTPKIFGFKVHENAKLARWQEQQRQDMMQRLADNQKKEIVKS